LYFCIILYVCLTKRRKHFSRNTIDTVFRMDKLKLFSLISPRCTIVRWWNHDGTMARWRNREGTMVKPRWHDGETRRHDGTMVKTRCNIAVSSSYHRGFTIVVSPSCHRCFTIVVSSSYHRCFIIVPSPSGEACAIPLIFYFINERAQHMVIYVINSNKTLTRRF
jgi:hypothetical protein